MVDLRVWNPFALDDHAGGNGIKVLHLEPAAPCHNLNPGLLAREGSLGGLGNKAVHIPLLLALQSGREAALQLVPVDQRNILLYPLDRFLALARLPGSCRSCSICKFRQVLGFIQSQKSIENLMAVNTMLNATDPCSAAQLSSG